MDMRRKLMTIKEAADYLGMSEVWVRMMVREQGMPHVRIGRGRNKPIKFTQQILDKWINDNVVVRNKFREMDNAEV